MKWIFHQTARLLTTVILFGSICFGGISNAAIAQTTGGWRVVGGDQDLSRYGAKMVTTLTVIDGMLYAGTDDGVYDLEKGTWHPVGKSGGFNTYELLNAYGTLFGTFASNGTLFARFVSRGVGVFDKGKWYQVGKSEIPNIYKIAVLGNTLYAGAASGIYSLENNGTWRIFGGSSSPQLSSVGFLANVGGTLFADGNTPYADGNGNRKKVDNGLVMYRNGTWQPVGTLISENALVRNGVNALVRYGHTLYAATDGGVYTYSQRVSHSSSAVSWILSGLRNAGPVNALLVMHGVLFAGTESGVYSLTAGSWHRVGADILDPEAGGPAPSLISTLYGIGQTLYAAGVNVYSFHLGG